MEPEPDPTPDPNVPKTGDTGQAQLWFVLSAVSAAAMALVVSRGRKKHEDN